MDAKLLSFVVHYGNHFVVPLLWAALLFRSRWKAAVIVLWATMLIDVDHLLATPIYDPARCSIGFHPLHSEWAIGIYFLLLFFPKSRIVAIGLLYHMLTDYQDCLWMWYINP